MNAPELVDQMRRAVDPLLTGSMDRHDCRKFGKCGLSPRPPHSAGARGHHLRTGSPESSRIAVPREIPRQVSGVARHQEGHQG